MPYQTGIPYIDTLLSDLQPHWNGIGSFNSPAIVTYSFVEDKDVYNASTSPGIEAIDFSAFSAAQRDAARDAFNLWSSVANITFVEVADTEETHGDIRLLNSNDIIEEFGAAGLAFYPLIGQSEDRQSSDNEVAGDVVIAPASSGTQDFSEFGFGRLVLIHEIGHALGLNHPNDEDSPLQIPAGENNDRYTIMTTPETSASPNAFGNNVYATSPMLYDIAAIQHLYGANVSTNSGNTIYEFLSNDSQIKVLWDAGGIDTIAVSTHVQRTYINLNPGTFSSMFPYPANPSAFPSLTTLQNVGIAYNVWIENAIGGMGEDTIIGNALDNYLTGGGDNDFASDHLVGGDGNDILDGGRHNDYMEGGKGDDIFYVTNDFEMIVELPGEGFDIIYSSALYFTIPDNIERTELIGVADINIFGTDGNNLLIGNSGRNQINGKGGDDFLDGGTGEDTLTGGDGNDVFIVDNERDIVIEVSAYSGSGTDVVKSHASFRLPDNVEQLELLGTGHSHGVGSQFANIITGNVGNNILSGEAGDDLLIGGLGDDVIYGDAGPVLDRYIYVSALTIEEGRVIQKYDTDGTLQQLFYQVPYPQTNGQWPYISGEMVRDIIMGEDSALYIFNGTSSPYVTIYGSGSTGNYTYPEWNMPDSTILGDIEKYGNYLYLNDYQITEDGSRGILRFDINNSTFVRFAEGTGHDPVSIAVNSSGQIYVVSEAVADQIYVYDPLTLGLDHIINLTSDITGDITVDAAGNIYGYSEYVIKKFNTAGQLLNSVDIDNDVEFITTGGRPSDIEVSDIGHVMVSTGDTFVLLLNNTLELIKAFRTTNSSSGNPTFATFGEQIIRTYNGNDTVSYREAGGSVVVNLMTGNGSGADGNDTLIDIENIEGSEFDDQLTGSTISNYIYGFGGNDTLNGGLGSDVMEGGIGNDIYVVNVANDFIVENVDEGQDTVHSSSTFTLSDNIENLVMLADGLTGSGNGLVNTITGSTGDDTLYGYGENDFLIGNSGNDHLDGGAGNDVMTGGEGNDAFYINSDLDSVVELAGQGTDQVYSYINYTLVQHLENLTLLSGPVTNGVGNGASNVITGNQNANLLEGMDGNDVLTGLEGDDILAGGDGNDLLDGGSGNDVMSGGVGNDSYYVDTVDDILHEVVNEGEDSVNSYISYTLGNYFENLTLLTGAGINGIGNTANNILTGNQNDNELTGHEGDDTISGMEGNDTLTGGTGNDLLDGGVGNDVMTGGSGNDSYWLSSIEDSPVENEGEGEDLIYSSFSYTLQPQFEHLQLTGMNTTGLGNHKSNLITGGSSNDVLYGLDNHDTLSGNAGNDTLDGGAGNDVMIGGTGNDSYWVNTSGDTPVENPDEGQDSIRSTVTYTLPSHFENLYLLTADTTATGNELANLLVGSSGGHEVLLGLGGDDTLVGNSGADLLDGGDGNDVLNGGEGVDTLIGGRGNDTYHVNTLQDSIIESGGQGTDHVISRIDYTLGDPLEDLTLQEGFGGTQATGNVSSNAISGNSNNNQLSGLAGNDMLSGQGGNDSLLGGRGHDDLRGGSGNDYHDGGYDANLMAGGAGNDTYIVRRGDGDGLARSGAAEDQVIELLNEGADTVESHVYSYALTANVENLVLAGAYALKGFGNGLNNVLVGNDRDNLLQGGEGNDELYGGAGRDNLSGGAGNDVLRGDAGIDILSGGSGQDVFVFNNAGSVDFVVDFTGGVDRLHLLLSLFDGIGTVGSTMSSGSFRTGINPLAADADDHVLYNSQSGALFYDPDGNGTDVMWQFATLSGAPALVSSDIWVIA